MNLINIKIKYTVTLLLIFTFFTDYLYSQINTDNAELLQTDRFKVKIGVDEYFKNNEGNVFVIPITLQLGLAKRVEFRGIFPYIQLRQKSIAEMDNIGDILVYLKFDIGKFMFKYPSFLFSGYVRNYIDFVTGFDIATGPSKEEVEEFANYSTGLPDWRVGIFYGQQVSDLSININFLYVFASYQGEEYLPFSSEIFSSSKKSYFFDIHKVIVKFLWPGRYPWTKDDATLADKYPHSDDYFLFNTSINYDIYPDFSLFDYDFFIELNWIQSFHTICLKQTEVLLTLGMQIYLSGSTTILGGISFPIDNREYYFDKKYFIGITFLL